MKSYTITVNGNVYDVTVEENGSVATPVAAPRRAVAPVAAPVKAAAAPAASGNAGSIKVEAGAAGKVFKIEANVGTAVKAGDAVAIEVAEEFGRYLAKALNIIAIMVDPDMFVIGGGVSKAGNVLLDYIEKYYKENALWTTK